MRFAKYEGTGNDFVVLDRLTGGALVAPSAARFLCDRHRGVGADGVLTLLPEAGAAGRMHLYNADGSVAEMCGNGIRCLVRYMIDAAHLPPSTTDLDLAAGTRRVHCTVLPEGRVRVDMGTPEPLAVRLRHPEVGDADEVLLHVGEASWRGTALSLGNPHLVLFLDDPPRAMAERFGAALEAHPGFADRVNVSFVRGRGQHLEAVVYERGVGITQACGSGAGAIGIAAVRRGRARRGEPIQIALPGGELSIRVGDGDRVILEGPARRVFAGDLDLPETA